MKENRNWRAKPTYEQGNSFTLFDHTHRDSSQASISASRFQRADFAGLDEGSTRSRAFRLVSRLARA